MMLLSLNTTETKKQFAQIINWINQYQDRFLVLRWGNPVAALISLEDLEWLEHWDEPIIELPPDDDQALILPDPEPWADMIDLSDLIAEIENSRQNIH